MSYLRYLLIAYIIYTLPGCIPAKILVNDNFILKEKIADEEFLKIWGTMSYDNVISLKMSFKTNDSVLIVPSAFSVYCNDEKLSTVSFHDWKHNLIQGPYTLYKEDRTHAVYFHFILNNNIHSDNTIINMDSVIWKNDIPIDIDNIMISFPSMVKETEYKEKEKVLKQER